MNEIQQLSAVQLTGKIRSREISAREALASHINAIEEVNGAINAVVTTDFERAQQLAAAADEASARGEATGLLHGLPMTHKDTFNTAGLRSTQGSLALEHNVPEHDDLQIARLTAAGAIRTGKTNVPEFGAGSHTFNEVFGTTTNPYATDRSAGGSSGGVAAAIAARIQPLGDGSDMGGSLRIPASFCNVIGFRPSYGVIPLEAPSNAYSWLARSGPMARSVEDISLFMQASAGDAQLPTPNTLRGQDFAQLAPNLKGVRIGYSFDFGIGVPVEQEVIEVLRGQLAVFEAAGAILEEASIDFREADEVFGNVRAFDFATNLGALVEAKGELIKPEVRWNVKKGLDLDGAAMISTMAARTRLQRAVQDFYSRYDIFLSPAAQVLPFDASWRWPEDIAGTRAETYLDWMRSACLLSAASLPVIAMPAGFTASGLPVGWQLAANHYQDAALLNWAAGYEQLTNFAATAPQLAIDPASVASTRIQTVSA
ncbi:amidase [Glutamicibacter uratoxydans]|uniref:Amidase n=1 Tax=Glutamicibacter uratoxydans TaxID=43667 RepID=A0A4Y4DPH4_GLUUR|nr:amidase family protein [Glutamicibacter uratoxydans]GED07249.1 amidase [Glutamicibacter uratoxydans]